MPGLTSLLLCYGVCFGLMNKVPFLHGRSAFLDKMLKCSYCTGFHSGYISWFMNAVATCSDFGLHSLGQALVWAFSSSAACFILDTTTQLLEKQLSAE